MSTVAIADVQSHLAELLDRAERGEAIAITRNGRHVATLVPAETGAPEIGEITPAHVREFARTTLPAYDPLYRKLAE